MNSKNCILLSHVWILDNQEYKKDIVNLCVKHFKFNNPNSYIILTGHGNEIGDDTKSLCDYVHWQNLDKSEIGKGHPKLVNIGLQHAKRLGFRKILKQRADCIIAKEEVHDYYDNIMGNKNLLVTNEHNSGDNQLGDLLVYGDIDLLIDGWNINLWNTEVDGTINFYNALSNHDELSFTSIENLRWVFLDPAWDELKNKKQEIIKNKIDYKKYLWGNFSSRAQHL